MASFSAFNNLTLTVFEFVDTKRLDLQMAIQEMFLYYFDFPNP